MLFDNLHPGAQFRRMAREYEHTLYPCHDVEAAIGYYDKFSYDLDPALVAFIRDIGTIEIEESDYDYHDDRKVWAKNSWLFETELIGNDAGDSDFYDPRLECIGPAVGQQGGSDVLVQIMVGPHKGKLAMCDHNSWHSFAEEFLEVTDGHLPNDPSYKVSFKSFDTAKPEQICADLMKAGYLCEYDMTFAEFWEQREALANHAAEKNAED